MRTMTQMTDAEIPPLSVEAGKSAPRVLVNATTCTKGGALQMATMFLQQAIRAPAEFEWRFAVSEAVHRELSRFGVELREMQVFESSPARDRASRARLLDFEREANADLVFTVAGPAYVRFRARHVVVCAEPWVTHAGVTAYRSLRFPDEWLKYYLWTRYKRRSLRAASAWILQTETARQGLCRRLGIPLERCFVIPATCDAQYRGHEQAISFPRGRDGAAALLHRAVQAQEFEGNTGGRGRIGAAACRAQVRVSCLRCRRKARSGGRWCTRRSGWAWAAGWRIWGRFRWRRGRSFIERATCVFCRRCSRVFRRRTLRRWRWGCRS